MEQLKVGAVGIAFRGPVTDDDDDTIIDISQAITKELYFRKPGGAIVTKDADFVTNGSDGLLEYITVDSSPADLDVPGTWWVESYVVLPFATLISKWQWFDVKPRLGDGWPR